MIIDGIGIKKNGLKEIDLVLKKIERIGIE